MMTIYKYMLGPSTTTIEMPKGAKILCVQVQYGSPCIWAQVESNAPMQERKFGIYGTGHQLPNEKMTYIGTFQIEDRQLVSHLFEIY